MTTDTPTQDSPIIVTFGNMAENFELNTGNNFTITFENGVTLAIDHSGDEYSMHISTPNTAALAYPTTQQPVVQSQLTTAQAPIVATTVTGNSNRTQMLKDAGRKAGTFVKNGILVVKALVNGFDAQSIEALTGKTEGQPSRNEKLLDRAPLTPELLNANYEFIVIKITDTSYITFKKVNGKWILTPLVSQKGLNILAQVQNLFSKKPTQPIQAPTAPVRVDNKQDMGYEALLTKYLL